MPNVVPFTESSGLFSTDAKRGLLLKRGVVLRTAFIDMYAQCGALHRTLWAVFRRCNARAAFEKRGRAWQCLDRRLECIDWGICLTWPGSAGLFSADAKRGPLSRCNHLRMHLEGMWLADSDVDRKYRRLECIDWGTGNIVAWNAVDRKHRRLECIVDRKHRLLECIDCGICATGAGPDRSKPFLADAKRDADMGIKFHVDIVSHGLLKKMSCLGMPWLTCLLNAVHLREKELEKLFVRSVLLECTMVRKGHISLGNYLVAMLTGIGSVGTTQRIFDGLVLRVTLSWDSLISGYVKNARSDSAFHLYQEMDISLSPSIEALITLLKARIKLKDMERGIDIHAKAARIGLLQKDLFVGNTMVDTYTKFGFLDMYAKCGWLAKGEDVFARLVVNVVSWTSLTAGYAEHGRGEEALSRFEEMQVESVSLDAVTYGYKHVNLSSFLVSQTMLVRGAC